MIAVSGKGGAAKLATNARPILCRNDNIGTSPIRSYAVIFWPYYNCLIKIVLDRA